MLPERLKDVTEIPEEIVSEVITSIQNTFENITGDRPVFLEECEKNSLNKGIIGNIAVFNPQHTLSLMMAVPKDTAIALSEAFCGEPLEFESEDLGDLIGELSNILAGEVAANIEQVGFRGQSSLPTATRGSDMHLFLPNKPPSAKLWFTAGIGEFWVFLALYESQRR
jgi:chemotaxis protein CheX